MHVFAEVVLAIAAVVVVTTVGVAAVAAQRVRRALRLVPQRATPAPLLWLVHPGRPAQLHRRLRRSCRLVTATVGSPGRTSARSRPTEALSPLRRVGAEMVDQAVVLDSRLAVADRMRGPARRATLQELSAKVRSLEAATARICRLDAAWREHQRSLDPIGQRDLDLRLDAVEAAMVELRIQPPAAS